jgi:hypothetical protein
VPCSARACMGSFLALPSDVAHLIVHFLCCYSVENTQEPPCNVPRWATDRNDDPVMGLTCRKICLCKRLEVHTIMGEQGFVLTDRIGQLLGIVISELPCFLCCVVTTTNPRARINWAISTSTSSSRYSSMKRRLIGP